MGIGYHNFMAMESTQTHQILENPAAENGEERNHSILSGMQEAHHLVNVTSERPFLLFVPARIAATWAEKAALILQPLLPVAL